MTTQGPDDWSAERRKPAAPAWRIRPSRIGFAAAVGSAILPKCNLGRSRAATALGAATVLAYVSAFVWANGINLVPHSYDLSQEYTAFVFGRLADTLDRHPLFYSDAYLAVLHLIPFSLLTKTSVTVTLVLICATTPALLLFLTLRRLDFSALSSAAAVIITYSAGSVPLQQFMHLPNPFLIYNAVNFRMAAFTGAAVAAYFCARRHWFLAGLGLGLAAASHAKFGMRLWGLTTAVIVICAMVPAFRPWSIGWKDFGRLQAGFVLLFFSTLRQLLGVSAHFDTLALPRAPELISPLGFLLKNEPDDWLLLFNSTRHIAGALALAVAVIALSGWLLRRNIQKNLRGLAVFALVTNTLMVVAILVELWLEYIGLSWLPWRPMLTFVLVRLWDIFWVAPLFLGLLITLALATLPRRPIGTAAIALAMAACMAGAVRAAVSHRTDRAFLDYNEHPPSYAIDYVVLTVCSANQAEHARHQADATAALWARDRKAFATALDGMDATFSAAVKGTLPRIGSDLEAANMRAMFEMREGRYAAGFSLLRAQAERIATVSRWYGDVAWRCKPAARAEEASFEAVSLPWRDFDAAAEWIANNTPIRARVIHMASLGPAMSRTKRVSFWETKVDSHAMYSFPGYYSIGLDRLAQIAGPSAIELTPNFRFGDAGERGRQFFLSLTREDFARIGEIYGPYDYVLTEVGHRLALPVLYANEHYQVYACCAAPP